MGAAAAISLLKSMGAVPLWMSPDGGRIVHFLANPWGAPVRKHEDAWLMPGWRLKMKMSKE